MTHLLFIALMQVVTLDSGAYIKHCREAREGCPARIRHYADLIVDASQQTGVDPWIIAAKMVLSSGLNPDLVDHRTGAFGLISIHPKDRLARWCPALGVDVLPARSQCAKRLSSEQTVLRYAAALVSFSSTCGSLERGMMMWSTGECQTSDHPLWQKKVVLVLKTADYLKRIARDYSIGY